jgi:acyl-coenzyme A synthetase/AMP-(fatty) acid ligase
MNAVADGAVGELCICGPQTVSGYWRDAPKSAERFVTIPAVDSSGLCFYRTGDRVMRLPVGDYVYLGRTDHQVKVLGYRVELAEIEAVLRQQPGVHEAVALGWPVQSGTAEGIIAFVSGAQPDPVALKTASGQRLPDYMNPRAVIVLSEFPLNANGKIDRKALLQALDSGQIPPADACYGQLPTVAT